METIKALNEICHEVGICGKIGGAGMIGTELGERIAERAAVTAASLVGSKIAEQIAKGQLEILHASPITERGKRILGEPPLCYDFRNTRSWVMVRAWQRMEEEQLPRLPVGEAWQEVRQICAMSPETVEAKRPELCSLSHMEKIPACARGKAPAE